MKRIESCDPPASPITPSGNWDDQVETFQELLAMFALAVVWCTWSWLANTSRR